MLRAALPVFVAVRLRAALVVPRGWWPKVRLAADKRKAGTPGVTPHPDMQSTASAALAAWSIGQPDRGSFRPIPGRYRSRSLQAGMLPLLRLATDASRPGVGEADLSTAAETIGSCWGTKLLGSKRPYG